MTFQVCDELIYEGFLLYTFVHPLEILGWEGDPDHDDYPETLFKRPGRPKLPVDWLALYEILIPHTANRKGYIARWEVINYRLHLSQFRLEDGNEGTQIPLFHIFPEHKGRDPIGTDPIFADWFSGEMPVWGRETPDLEFRDGIMVREIWGQPKWGTWLGEPDIGLLPPP